MLTISWGQAGGIMVTIIGGVISATAFVINKFNTSKSEITTQFSASHQALLAEISGMKTTLAVMEEREKNEGAKIEQMWQWWLKSIENGWIAEMKRSHAAGSR
jgi:hypothetical protein